MIDEIAVAVYNVLCKYANFSSRMLFVTDKTFVVVLAGNDAGKDFCIDLTLLRV